MKLLLESRAQRRLADTEAWEKKKKASLEAKHKQIEIEAENLKHKKLEQLKNKEAGAQKTIQEEKAAIEAQREKSTMKVEDKASKYRASNSFPKKFFGFC
ncbi:Remorin family protein [Tripterygium wilfordii]|uniref:Remorin family protein n=1 Tax=Tripterygium wilfordii TaxID=458696 RepID=A0A7J7CE28_TRIWF|nr:Remorin family protein [Tripterygium wilfordii]